MELCLQIFLSEPYYWTIFLITFSYVSYGYKYNLLLPNVITFRYGCFASGLIYTFK